MSSYFYEHTLPEVNKNINLISLIACCLSLTLLITLSYFRSHILNRVTIRFQAILTLVDLVRHITLLNLEQPEGFLCAFLGFLGFFSDHLYVFINVIMAINIQLIYLQDVRPKRKLELILICFAIFIALALDGIPLFFDVFGQNSTGGCFLKDGDKNIIFSFILLYTTLPPGMIYCLGVFIAVIISLHLKKDYIDNKIPDKRMLIGGEVVNSRDFVKKLYFRMSFYPVTSSLCFLGYLLNNFLFDINLPRPEILQIVALISIRSTGIINLISLMFDPHFHIAVKSIWLAREEYEYRDDLKPDVELTTIRALKREEPKYYVDFLFREPLSYEEYITFL